MFKRNLNSFCVVGLLLALSLRADTSLNVGISPGFPGIDVSVPVRLNQATNIAAFQFDVTYDPSRVTVKSVTPNSIGPSATVLSRTISTGLIRFVVYSLDPISVTNLISVAEIEFSVPEDERIGSGPISPVESLIVRGDATPVAPHSLNSGAIFVKPVHFTPSGVRLFLTVDEPDTEYAIHATSDFIDWTILSTNQASGHFMDLFDPDGAVFPKRFYRTVPQP